MIKSINFYISTAGHYDEFLDEPVILLTSNDPSMVLLSIEKAEILVKSLNAKILKAREIVNIKAFEKVQNPGGRSGYQGGWEKDVEVMEKLKEGK